MKRLAMAGLALCLIASVAAHAAAVDDANAGLNALNHGDYPTAVRLLTQALREGGLSESDRELAYVKRGKAYIGENRDDLALADLDRALKLDPTDPEAASLKAQAQDASTGAGAAAGTGQDHANSRTPGDDWPACNNVDKDADAGIAACTRIALSADTMPAHLRAIAFARRSLGHQNKGDLDDAIIDMTQAIRLDPNLPVWHYARGVYYGNDGKPQPAIVDFSEAIRLNPHVAAYFTVRALAYEHVGNATAALADYRSAYRLDPTNQDASKGIERLTAK